MLDKVIDTIEKYKMIEKGEGIVVGFSGGPDSVSLLHVLCRLREKYNISLYAVHLNHMIRGEEADRDEEYARKFADSLGIPFYSERIKVEEYARQNGLSSEEAGRFLRYGLFDRVLKTVGADKIALAHNMNDQAETVLMRIIRGTGISGMVGIKPVRDEKYIRPIIACSRREIEEYCSTNGLNPVIDSTNKENIYTRNRIRLELIPYIEKNFNTNLVENLYKSSQIIRDEDDYLDMAARLELDKIILNRGVERDKFKKLHMSLKRRIIRMLIEEAKGDLNGIESKHIDDSIDFVENSTTGKSINLPKGLRCTIEYNCFRIEEKYEHIDFEYKINVPGIIKIKEAEITVKTRIIEEKFENPSDKPFVKYFDYDKIKGVLLLRNRRDGDYIYPKGMNGVKKLKDIFIDKKIPKDKRDNIPLVTIKNEVIWVLGVRDSSNYKVDEDTKRILEIIIERGELIESGNREGSI